MAQTVPHFVSQWERTPVMMKGNLSVSKATKALPFVLSVFLTGLDHQVVLHASIFQPTVPSVTIETSIHPLTVPLALALRIHKLTAPRVFLISSKWEATAVE